MKVEIISKSANRVWGKLDLSVGGDRANFCIERQMREEMDGEE